MKRTVLAVLAAALLAGSAMVAWRLMAASPNARCAEEAAAR